MLPKLVYGQPHRRSSQGTVGAKQCDAVISFTLKSAGSGRDIMQTETLPN